MPALVVKFESVTLSFTADAITVYIKPNLSGLSMASMVDACSQLEFVDKNAKGFITAVVTEISSQSLHYHKKIHSKDADHNLYHQDNLDPTHLHYHFKFKNNLSKAEVTSFLQKLVDVKFITANDMQSFLIAFQQRYEEIDKHVDTLIMDCHCDLRILKRVIAGITDNDKLDYLHKTLLAERFDYLRQAEYLVPFWSGTDISGKVVWTSKTWAQIEKSISLQMANNIKMHVSKFDHRLAHERAHELAHNYPFFALKRYTLFSLQTKNKAYQAFEQRDEKKFDELYSRNFAGIK